jgi:hypothetical protein
MNWYGSGYLLLLNYANYAEAAVENKTLETENGFNLLTEDGKELLVET